MSPRALPVGVGWRAPHDAGLRADADRLDFAEVHAENHFGEGAGLADVLRLREALPVSLHGVGLGLGSARGIDPLHLNRLARLVERVEPLFVSEHASFARVAPGPDAGPVHGADLWPLPCTEAALDRLVSQVQQVQERLKRPLLVEHLSSYLRWQDVDMDEPMFFMALCRRSGCQLLLDLNNLVVNALNDGAQGPAEAAAWAQRWVDGLTPGTVGEIHLAGHTDHGGLVIDDHGAPVPPAVWQAYAHALRRLGPVPTLVEWDSHLPAWPVLLAEAQAVRLQAQVALAGGAVPDDRGARAAPAARGVQPGPHADLAASQWQWWQAVQAAIDCPPRREAEPAVAWVTEALPADAPVRVQQRWPAATAAQQRQRALWAYAVQALGHAERALAAAYPRLHARIGDEALKALGRDLWRAHPCASGDLADWGAELAPWMQAAADGRLHHEGLQALLALHPELPVLARLEWALHQAARAEWPLAANTDWLGLAHRPPEQVRLVPAAGACLVAIPDGQAAACPGLEGPQAWVWRRGQGAEWASVSAREAAALASVLAGCSLADLLAHWVSRGLVDEAGLAGAFEAWWLRALREEWLAGWSAVGAAAPEATRGVAQMEQQT